MAASKASRIDSLEVPERIIELVSRSSGRSVESRISTQGVLRIAHSSGTVHESVRTQNADFSLERNSLNQNGLESETF